MSSSVTIMFSYLCESDPRRAYLLACINSLFKDDGNAIVRWPILVVDGSDSENFKLNRALFPESANLTHIHDETENPIERISNHLDKINTKFVLRLLEDCIYLGFGDLSCFSTDASLLDALQDVDAVQYPLVESNILTKKGKTINYIPNEFVSKKTIKTCNLIKYYDREEERIIHPYLCHNIMYRTSFFRKHIRHYAKHCTGHNFAETSIFQHGFISSFEKIMLPKKRNIIRLVHKLMYREYVLKSIIVSETMEVRNILHIGYESTESGNRDNPARESVGSGPATSSVLTPIEIFSNYKEVPSLNFVADTNTAI
jgi:hypothetical protein